MKEIRIDRMEDLVQQLNQFPNHYIFRGHGRQSWPLEPTIDRMFPRAETDVLRKVEDYSLQQFTSRYHLYDHGNRTPESKLEWLSLMQHYGVPTRLLDFTDSPYVALYFAIETSGPEQDEDPCIHAIDYRALLKVSIDEIKSVDRDFTKTYEEVVSSQDIIFEEVIDRFSRKILWVTEPSRVNVRLDRQSGSFLLSGKLGHRIEDLLNSSLYSSVDYQKIIIPKDFYSNVFVLLKKVNINSTVIYGDLSGLGRAIRMTLYAYT